MKYGMELVLDLVKCNDRILHRNDIQEFVSGLCNMIDMVPYGNLFVDHFGHNDENTSGLSFLQFIETSSITGHVSDKNRSLHMNVFSCRDFNPADVIDFVMKFFDCEVNNSVVLERSY